MLRTYNRSVNTNESNTDLSRWHTGGTTGACAQAAEPRQYVCNPENRPPRSETYDDRWSCEKSEKDMLAEAQCRERDFAVLVGSTQTANCEAMWGEYDTCAQVEQCVPLRVPCDVNKPEEFVNPALQYNYNKVRGPSKFFEHEQLVNPVDDTPLPRIDAASTWGLSPIHAPEPNPEQVEFIEPPMPYYGERAKGREECQLRPVAQRVDVPSFNWS